MSTVPRRSRGRTLIERDPNQLIWILSARESDDREEQVNNQLADLREFVKGIGGRVAREVPENDVSSFKKKRVQLPDGTYGYRVIRPDWESILTDLRRGTANALAVPDIDRATRDPRLLEDLIEVVEHYGAYVKDLTGVIDLTTDAGIHSAREMVNQRNSESRNTSRRVMDGQRHAAEKGGNHGGPYRPFGWRSDRIHVNKREVKHLRRELPRIIGTGVSPLTLAQEWNKRGIPTVMGGQWRAATIRNIYLNPRICGFRTYHDEILRDENNQPVKGQWEPILNEDEYNDVVAAWRTSKVVGTSRLGGKGRGYRTVHLLSPFVRCGLCNARMVGSPKRDPRSGKMSITYRCPAKGQGGCGRIGRAAEPVDEYITRLVIEDQTRNAALSQNEEAKPWPREHELIAEQKKIADQIRAYEAGQITAERHFPSLARMERKEQELKREKAKYEKRNAPRRTGIPDLEDRWNQPGFTMEQKQAVIAQSLTAVVILPAGKGVRFRPDQIKPIFRED